MCSNLLQGSIWAGPAKGRKKGSGRKPKSNNEIISPSLSIMDKPKSIDKYKSIDKPLVEITSIISEDIIDETPKSFSEFKRTVYFKSDCNNKEKTYLYSLGIGTYYHCSVCHDYHKIREIG